MLYRNFASKDERAWRILAARGRSLAVLIGQHRFDRVPQLRHACWAAKSSWRQFSITSCDQKRDRPSRTPGGKLLALTKLSRVRFEMPSANAAPCLSRQEGLGPDCWSCVREVIEISSKLKTNLETVFSLLRLGSVSPTAPSVVIDISVELRSVGSRRAAYHLCSLSMAASVTGWLLTFGIDLTNDLSRQKQTVSQHKCAGWRQSNDCTTSFKRPGSLPNGDWDCFADATTPGRAGRSLARANLGTVENHIENIYRVGARMNTFHNPDRFMSDLRQILSQGRKRIGLLVGAGAPMSLRVNEIGTLVSEGGRSLMPGVEELAASRRSMRATYRA